MEKHEEFKPYPNCEYRFENGNCFAGGCCVGGHEYDTCIFWLRKKNTALQATLAAVMRTIDKWLGSESDLENDNLPQRAADAREVALKEIERLQAEVERLRDDRKLRDFMIKNGLSWEDMENDYT